MIGLPGIWITMLPGEKIHLEKFPASLDREGKGGSAILVMEMEEVPGLGSRGNLQPGDGEEKIPRFQAGNGGRRIFHHSDHRGQVELSFLAGFFIQAGLDQQGTFNLSPQLPDLGDDR
jgi:hypothetical protein